MTAWCIVTAPCLLLDVLFLSTVLGLQVDIAVSPSTLFNPALLVNDFQEDSIRIIEIPCELLWGQVVLDYTYSVHYSLQLRLNASDSLVICMYEDCPEQEISSRISTGQIQEKFVELIRELPFRNVFLMNTATSRYQEESDYMQKGLPLIFTHRVVLAPGTNYTEALNLVGRLVKPAGTNLGVLLLDEVSGENVLKALEEYGLLGEGFVYVTLQETVWGVIDTELANGLIYVSDKELAGVRSREEFERKLLKS